MRGEYKTYRQLTRDVKWKQPMRGGIQDPL